MPLPREMLPGVVNSPETMLATAINAAQTTITVMDADKAFPTVPCYGMIGYGEETETVRVASKSGNNLVVERGHQGVAKAWDAGTGIACRFGETDKSAYIANIEHLESSKSDKPKTVKNHPFAQTGWVQQADERWRYTITETTPRLFVAGWDPGISGYAPLDMGDITEGSQLLPENMENGTLYVWCANQPTADFTANIRMIPSVEEVIA